jgi:hypothetical protein
MSPADRGYVQGDLDAEVIQGAHDVAVAMRDGVPVERVAIQSMLALLPTMLEELMERRAQDPAEDPGPVPIFIRRHQVPARGGPATTDRLAAQ